MTTVNTKNILTLPGSDSLNLNDCNTAVFKNVGQLIHNAAQSDSAYVDLREHTADRLVQAGVPETSVTGMQFYLVKDDDDLVHIRIPEVKSKDDFGGNTALFQAYLTELGLVTLRACKR